MLRSNNNNSAAQHFVPAPSTPVAMMRKDQGSRGAVRDPADGCGVHVRAGLRLHHHPTYAVIVSFHVKSSRCAAGVSSLNPTMLQREYNPQSGINIYTLVTIRMGNTLISLLVEFNIT